MQISEGGMFHLGKGGVQNSQSYVRLALQVHECCGPLNCGLVTDEGPRASLSLRGFLCLLCAFGRHSVGYEFLLFTMYLIKLSLSLQIYKMGTIIPLPPRLDGGQNPREEKDIKRTRAL